MTMIISLTKDRNATIVCIFSNYGESRGEQDGLLQSAKSTLRNIHSTDKLLLIGDFNARIGRENDK